MLGMPQSKGIPLFGSLSLMYIVTYFGEGLVIMYLFNNVRINGMNITISAIFSLISYVPSLILTAANLALHSKFSLTFRLVAVASIRAMVCLFIAFSGVYVEVVPTIIFIALMEVLWYWLMPCFDELENRSIHQLGTGRGESILTIVLQGGLAASLLFGGMLYDRFGAQVVLFCIAALQLCIPLLCLVARGIENAEEAPGQIDTAQKLPEGVDASSCSRRFGLLPLMLVLGVLATLPQVVNVVSP